MNVLKPQWLRIRHMPYAVHLRFEVKYTADPYMVAILISWRHGYDVKKPLQCQKNSNVQEIITKQRARVWLLGWTPNQINNRQQTERLRSKRELRSVQENDISRFTLRNRKKAPRSTLKKARGFAGSIWQQCAAEEKWMSKRLKVKSKVVITEESQKIAA